MAQARPRYFVNRLTDYNGELSLLDPEEIQEKCVQLAEQIMKMPSRNLEGGLYIGVSGVSYALYHTARSGHFPQLHRHLMIQAKSRVEEHIRFASRISLNEPLDDISFVLGGAGVYMCGAMIAAEIRDQDGVNTCLSLLADCIHVVVNSTSLDYLGYGSDELMVGRAGLLCAILNLRRQLNTPVISENHVTSLCTAIIHSGRQTARQRRSPIPLMYSYYGVEYIGAAHGLSGIFQMLISFPQNLRAVDNKAESDVKLCIDWLAARQLINGNWPGAMDELGEEIPDRQQLVHWCHGAPGIIHLMATAYLLWNEQRYMAACIRAGDCIWKLGLLTKGPGICHGIAGNAYAFLLIYRLSGDSKWLHRAHQFLAFLDADDYHDNARVPDQPYSLFEGLAGTLCCFVDLLRPQTAEFPLFPVAGLTMCYS